MAESDLQVKVRELTKGLDDLRLAHDLYFQGIERVPPDDQREKYKSDLRKAREEPNRNTALKFKLNQLWSKYQTYERLWLRVLREIEEGTYKRDKFKVALRKRKMGEAGAQKDGSAVEEVELDDMDFDIEEEEAEVVPEPPPRPVNEPKVLSPARQTVPAAARQGPTVAPAGTPPAQVGAPASWAPAPAPVPRTAPAGGVPIPRAGAPGAPRTVPVPGNVAGRTAPAPAPGAPRPAAGNVAGAVRPNVVPAPSPAGARVPVPAPGARAPGSMAIPATTRPGVPAPVHPAAAATRPPQVAAPRAAAAPAGDVSDDRVRALVKDLSEAKRQVGDRSETSFDAIKAQLVKTVPAIKQQHQAKSVDFQVVLKDGKAILKAIPKK
jgi:hypothetical protein